MVNKDIISLDKKNPVRSGIVRRFISCAYCGSCEHYTLQHGEN